MVRIFVRCINLRYCSVDIVCMYVKAERRRQREQNPKYAIRYKPTWNENVTKWSEVSAWRHCLSQCLEIDEILRSEKKSIVNGRRILCVLPYLAVTYLPDHASPQVGHVPLREREALLASWQRLQELAGKHTAVITVLLLWRVLRWWCQYGP